jgi:hypothetical protein
MNADLVEYTERIKLLGVRLQLLDNNILFMCHSQTNEMEDIEESIGLRELEREE